jgi:hypothetical protein
LVGVRKPRPDAARLPIAIPAIWHLLQRMLCFPPSQNIFSHFRSNRVNYLGNFCDRARLCQETGVHLFLFGIFVVLTPSILVIAWLLWRADVVEEASDLDRMM